MPVMRAVLIGPHELRPAHRTRHDQLGVLKAPDLAPDRLIWLTRPPGQVINSPLDAGISKNQSQYLALQPGPEHRQEGSRCCPHRHNPSPDNRVI